MESQAYPDWYQNSNLFVPLWYLRECTQTVIQRCDVLKQAEELTQPGTAQSAQAAGRACWGPLPEPGPAPIVPGGG